MSNLLYSEWLLNFIVFLIAYIPVFHKTLQEEPGMFNQNTKFNRFLSRTFKSYPRPTGWGKLFIFLALAYAFVSYKQSVKGDKEKSDFQAKLMIAEKSRERADSLYTFKLDQFEQGRIKSDTLHTKQTTAIIKQLDKWGLKIVDETVVKKSGTAILNGLQGRNPVHFNVKGDSVFIGIFLENTGTGVAKNVNVNAFLLIKYGENYYKKHKKPIGHFKGKVGIGRYLSMDNYYTGIPKNQGSYVILYNGNYQDENGHKEKVNRGHHLIAYL